MVRGDRLLAQPVGQSGSEPLRHPARVDEDEGGLVGLDRLGQPLVDLRPHLVRHHRLHRRRRHLDRQIHGAAVPLVDDGAVALAPQQEARDLADRLLRGRQPDALQRPSRHVPQPLQAERQVRPPPRIDHGMDLVHDYRAHGAEHRAAALGRQEQVERLRRGDQDVRRRAQHRGPARGRRVPRAHRGTDADGGQPRLHGALADGGERLLEVLVNVGAERLEGRDVEDPHLVFKTMLEPFAQQLVDGVQECGERLPGPGRGGEQSVAAIADGGPGALLRGKRRPQRLGEPALDDRVEGQGHREP